MLMIGRLWFRLWLEQICNEVNLFRRLFIQPRLEKASLILRLVPLSHPLVLRLRTSSSSLLPSSPYLRSPSLSLLPDLTDLILIFSVSPHHPLLFSCQTRLLPFQHPFGAPSSGVTVSVPRSHAAHPTDTIPAEGLASIQHTIDILLPSLSVMPDGSGRKREIESAKMCT
jgi:hypothetical protein